MARIVIIDCLTTAAGRWQVNLTDGAQVWGKRRYQDPGRALAYVSELILAGHRPAFPSAYVDLRDDAAATAPQAAD